MALIPRDDLEARKGVDLTRLAKRGGSSLTLVAMVVAVLILIFAVSLNLRHRWDVSRRGESTLSPLTLGVLGALESELEIYPLFTTNNPVRQDFWYFLQLYREATPQVSVTFIDPVARPGDVADLGLDAAQEDARRDGMTVIIQGDNKRIFAGISEEEVTNAIMDVSTTEPRVVGFLRGYGERDMRSDAVSGMSKLAVELLQEYYTVRDVFLADGIPPEVTVLLLAGPRIPIPDEDLQAVGQWLGDGGRLLVLVESDSDPGINELLAPWGLRFSTEIVVEPTRNVNRDPRFVKAASYTDHEIVDGFAENFPSGFPVVVKVEHFEPGNPLVFHESLIRSSVVSSVMSDGSSQDGPFDLAAASWKREPGQGLEHETRVVIVGDSDFASNQYLYYRANRNFLLNALGWLSREASLVSIRRESLGDQTLDISMADRSMLVASAYTAPALLVLVGTVVYLRRRGL